MGKNEELTIVDLFANANTKSSFKGEKFFFKGDICQRLEANKVAVKLGIKTEIDDGLPFVKSDKDFEKITKHIVSNKIEGWWHYVSYEEYCKIKGQHYFNGKYLKRNKEIENVSKELGIYIGNTNMNILYARTKEDYDKIIQRLDQTS